MIPDQEGMKRLGIDPASPIGVHHSQIGFEPYERDDGIHPDLVLKPNVAYNNYLKERGYEDHENPWHWAANSVERAGKIRSGFFNDVAQLPARVSEEE